MTFFLSSSFQSRRGSCPLSHDGPSWDGSWKGHATNIWKLQWLGSDVYLIKTYVHGCCSIYFTWGFDFRIKELAWLVLLRCWVGIFLCWYTCSPRVCNHGVRLLLGTYWSFSICARTSSGDPNLMSVENNKDCGVRTTAWSNPRRWWRHSRPVNLPTEDSETSAAVHVDILIIEPEWWMQINHEDDHHCFSLSCTAL
jgi:hypothetical protein